MIEFYRKTNHKYLIQNYIIETYEELLSGSRESLPKGTWKNDINVVLIIRYALEVRLKLTKEEIPKITKQNIKELKLWGALNRFKSIKKLLSFVYPGEFNEFDFHRLPTNYWANIEKIKARFEYKLNKNKIPFHDIPKHITYDLLINWGFSNPLKRHENSPYQLINTIYPGAFKPYEFRKIPQRFTTNKEMLKEQFINMVEREKIAFQEIPQKVTQDLLYKYKFHGAMTYYRNSTSKFIMSLFPDKFIPKDFIRPQGYWNQIESARNAILDLIDTLSIPYVEMPLRLTKKVLWEHGLAGLLDRYNGSPIELLQTCFPGEFHLFEYSRLPNRYWQNKKNRIEALRFYCEKNGIRQEDLPLLSRTYLKSNFPRFVSVLDRHYESKMYLWIIEAFPEHEFKPTDFNLLVGKDGQLCDSHEELLVHNILLKIFKDGKIKCEGIRFLNEKHNESYLPDWLVQYNGRRIIVEYFGLYGSERFPGYTEKVNRKIDFYNSLTEYEFITLFPKDLKRIEALLIGSVAD